MANMGTCVHCGREWESTGTNGKKVEPRGIPTCPEAEIYAICNECFDVLPSRTIVALVQMRERALRVFDNVPSVDPLVETVPITNADYAMVDSGIGGWVRYMKGEAPHPPFEESAFLM